MNKLIALIAALIVIGCDETEETQTYEPPLFITSVPVDGAVDVMVDTEISIIFDEKILIRTLLQ